MEGYEILKVEKGEKNYRKLIKLGIQGLIILGVCFFFYKEFRNNIDSIKNFQLAINWFAIIISILLVISTYLLETYAWQTALNGLSKIKKISFSKSIAVVNTTRFTKYLPGKIWSYAIQMYWLGNEDFNMAQILYVNIIATISTLMISIVIGGIYLSVFSHIFPSRLIIILLSLVGFGYILFVLFNSRFSGFLIWLVRRFFKRDLKHFDIPIRLILILQLIYLVSTLAFGVSAYFLCFGVGFNIGPSKMFTVISALLISDALGFIILLAPGGLGIREGLMYIILNEVSEKTFALIMPISIRVVTMLVDLLLGIIGMLLVKSFSKSQIAK